MKLYETLPDCVEVGGKRYKVDLDFRNVLRMLDTLARDDLIFSAREYLALKCVMKHPPKNAGEVLRAVKDILFPKTDGKGGGKKITSFEQDADLIRAAFRQAYNIDLYRDRVHWIEFSALLNALPDGSRYTEVLGIRARPMPKATKYNAEERQWLMKAKEIHALRMTEKERENKYESDVQNIFHGLLAWAEGGNKTDG